MSTALLHFHNELAALAGSSAVAYPVTRRASLKDVAEALGVPHTEIYGLEADGQPVGFGHILEPGQAVHVRPGVPPVDVTASHPLRPGFPAARFAVDVNAGRLATYLRLIGVDTAYSNDMSDAALAGLAAREERVVLTRDRGLLRRKAVVWGRLVTADDPVEQARDVVRFFGLSARAAPFTLCVRCNAALEPVAKKDVLHLLRPLTKQFYEVFTRCPSCGRVYWAGSHHDKMAAMAERLSPPGSARTHQGAALDPPGG